MFGQVTASLNSRARGPWHVTFVSPLSPHHIPVWRITWLQIRKPDSLTNPFTCHISLALFLDFLRKVLYVPYRQPHLSKVVWANITRNITPNICGHRIYYKSQNMSPSLAVFVVIVITLFCSYSPALNRCMNSKCWHRVLSVPPLGVFAIAGCGMDLFINIVLTILAYVFPFYPEVDHSALNLMLALSPYTLHPAGYPMQLILLSHQKIPLTIARCLGISPATSMPSTCYGSSTTDDSVSSAAE